MTALSQPGEVSRGKSDPERNHIGIRKRFITAWNAWVLSIFQAIRKPSAVKPTEIPARLAAPKSAPWMLHEAPTQGERRRKKAPCKNAMEAPPAILPRAMDHRGA